MGKLGVTGSPVMPWEARKFGPGTDAEKPSGPKKCIDKERATS